MMGLTDKKISLWALPLLAMLSSAPLYAAKGGESSPQPLLDKNKFSIGAGVSSNSVAGPIDDEIGFQFFAAYDLSRINLMEGVNTSIELGYMDYGFSGANAGGLWTTAVVDGRFGTSGFGWLARLGFDLGDDSGLMFGAGLGFAINKNIELRAEYVARDEINSIQFNVLYRM